MDDQAAKAQSTPGQTDAHGHSPMDESGFWDLGTSEMTLSTGVGPSVIVEAGAVEPKGRNSTTMALLLVLILFGGYYGYMTFVEKSDPLAPFLNSPLAVPVLQPQTIIESGITEIEPDEGEALEEYDMPVSIEVVEGNPYWHLTNVISEQNAPLARSWSGEEEEAFRVALAHQFQWQRHKAVREIRSLRLAGSDSVLWEAVRNKKYWTRILAAITLAEFNVEVSLTVIENIIGEDNHERIGNFLKRFRSEPSPGAAYVARQMIKVLEPYGRKVAVEILAQRPSDKLSRLYLVAATKDPAAGVAGAAAQALGRMQMPPAEWDEHMQVVLGKRSAKVASHKAAAKGPSSGDVEALTKGEMDESSFEDGVGFYDEQIEALFEEE